MKKAGHGHIAKSGHIGKTGPKLKASGSLSSSGKLGPSSSKLGSTSSALGSSSGKLVSRAKTSNFPSTPKSYTSPSYNVKSGKSTSFGIIWLPMKKRNKYKDVSYNSHKNERTKDRGPSMYGFMSGDSSNPLDHKKEETSLLVPENKASTSVAIIGAGAVTTSELPSDKITGTEEKQDLIKPEEESKDVTGDGDKVKDDYLENNDKVISTAPDSQTKDKAGDNVDSVFLRSPPPHKRRSTPPAAEEEEDCGIKCLYYTLQCCDCVLM